MLQEHPAQGLLTADTATFLDRIKPCNLYYLILWPPMAIPSSNQDSAKKIPLNGAGPWLSGFLGKGQEAPIKL
jgi:hypothetical protein